RSSSRTTHNAPVPMTIPATPPTPLFRYRTPTRQTYGSASDPADALLNGNDPTRFLLATNLADPPTILSRPIVISKDRNGPLRHRNNQCDKNRTDKDPAKNSTTKPDTSRHANRSRCKTQPRTAEISRDP